MRDDGDKLEQPANRPARLLKDFAGE